MKIRNLILLGFVAVAVVLGGCASAQRAFNKLDIEAGFKIKSEQQYEGTTVVGDAVAKTENTQSSGIAPVVTPISIFFSSGTTLLPGEEERLTNLTPGNVIVIGYSTPDGNFSNNIRLAMQRALLVKNILVSYGFNIVDVRADIGNAKKVKIYYQ